MGWPTGFESTYWRNPGFGNMRENRINKGRNRLLKNSLRNWTTVVKPNLSEHFLSCFVMQESRWGPSGNLDGGSSRGNRR